MRGQVKDPLRPYLADQGKDRVPVGEIHGMNRKAIEPTEPPAVTAWPDEGLRRMTARDQAADQVGANKACRAGDHDPAATHAARARSLRTAATTLPASSPCVLSAHASLPLPPATAPETGSRLR